VGISGPNESTRDAEASGTDGSVPRLAPDTVIGDRYRIIEFLAEGGMGAVYRAEHIHMRKSFALKVLHRSLVENPEVVARFEREAIAAGSIDHPNVACATDFGRLPDDSFFLVLEFVRGPSLRDVLDAGALEPARAMRIMRGIVAGVGAAHSKGIVHRDLKPENIMLVDHNGDLDFVKVLDFGIAKADLSVPAGPEGPAAPLTVIGSVMGTAEYMAPEQARGEAVDARSDLYSLGVIFYELLAGGCPFVGTAVSVLQRHVFDEPPPFSRPRLSARSPYRRHRAKAFGEAATGSVRLCVASRRSALRSGGTYAQGRHRSRIARRTTADGGPVAPHRGRGCQHAAAGSDRAVSIVRRLGVGRSQVSDGRERSRGGCGAAAGCHPIGHRSASCARTVVKSERSGDGFSAPHASTAARSSGFGGRAAVEPERTGTEFTGLGGDGASPHTSGWDLHSAPEGLVQIRGDESGGRVAPGPYPSPPAEMACRARWLRRSCASEQPAGSTAFRAWTALFSLPPPTG
jgi:hypothetical protein